MPNVGFQLRLGVVFGGDVLLDDGRLFARVIFVELARYRAEGGDLYSLLARFALERVFSGDDFARIRVPLSVGRQKRDVSLRDRLAMT